MSAKIDVGYTAVCNECPAYLGTYDCYGDADDKAIEHNKEHHPEELWPWKLK